MTEPYTAIQVVMMPKDANPIPTVLNGPDGNTQIIPFLTIFGGVILSYIDQAGAIGGRREIVRLGGKLPFLVTVAINRVEFQRPVLVGDVVRFLTRLVRVGRTSLTMHVLVEVARADQIMQVTEAEIVYVNIDPAAPDRRPIPLFPEGR
jgi:acyl-CoA thioesterase YciA